MAIKLIYKDEIPGAAEGATVNVSVKAENFSTPSLLPFGADTGGIATLEPNGWGLNRDYKVKGNQAFGFWSSEISDENGDFTNPPVITVTLDAQYLVTGFSLWFSSDTGDYCKEVNAVLYQGETVIYSNDFNIESTSYDLEVPGGLVFDKIVITLNKTSLPHRRAKLELLKIGITRLIKGDELIDANLLSEIDLTFDTIPSNTLDATFFSKQNAYFVFQKKQPIEVYNDDEFLGLYYIQDGKRESNTRYSFSACDIISGLEEISYNEKGFWIKGASAFEIMEFILGGIIPFELSEELASTELIGWCTGASVREAIQNVAFALGACIDTTGHYGIKLFKPKEGRKIVSSETFVDGFVEVSELITDVTVYYYYDWRHHEDPKDFNIPGHGDHTVEIGTVTVTNPNVPTGTTGKSLTFENCRLVSTEAQARMIAENILNHYMKRQKYTFSHVDKGQQVGEHVTGVLPWGKSTSGTILKKSVKHSGITVSETTLLLDD